MVLLQACTHAPSSSSSNESGSPLNVVFLVADDLRVDAVLGANASAVATPNLDRLAARGMAFSRAYCAGSYSGAVCAPSRGMLLSGRSLSSFIESPFNPKVDCTLMPEAFRAAGYETFGTGKWHSGSSWFSRSFTDGGNIFFGGMDPHVGLKTCPFDPSGAYPSEAAAPNPVFSSEAFANATVDFLDRRSKDKPFFAWVSFTAPHDPRTPPAEFKVDPQTVALPANYLTAHPFDNGEMIVRDEQLAAEPRVESEIKEHIADYHGLITHMDAQIGRILDELESSGELDNTVIVFVADHGLAIGSHGLLGKQNLYEHSMGAPLIIASPGVDAGTHSEALTYLYDLFPTVADLTGLPIPESVQGQSLAPVLHGEKTAHRDQILTAYRDVQRAVTEERWKYIDYPKAQETQLFDLQADPDEIHDLAGSPQVAEVEQRLKADLVKLQKQEQVPVAKGRPNILLMYSDDHASAAVSAYGSDLPATPNIDRLADQGLRFDNAFCTNAICGPARAVVLTGKHSHINGFMDNTSVFDGDQQTFPKLLQAAGYQTAVIGKWHLKTDPQGFDYWDILPGQGRYYSPEFINEDGKYAIPGYNTDRIADKAMDWMENGRNKDQPFMLMCQFKAPHRAWMAGPEEVGLFDGMDIPEPTTLFDDASGLTSAAREQEMSIDRHMWLFYDLKVPPLEGEELTGPDRWSVGRDKHMSSEELAAWNAAYEPRNTAFRAANLKGDDLVRWKYQRYIKDYLRCIQGIDRNVGRILDHLDKLGLSDNTIVIYSSDQGFFLGEHGWYDKRFMYEPSLKVPLLVRWPDVIAEGASRGELVQNLDFAPTFLELAGVKVPKDMQGKSMVPILRGHGTPKWRKAIYYEYSGEATHNVAAHYGVRSDQWKLIHYPDTDEWELLDMVNDPDEINNLAGDPAYAEVRAQLQRQLLELRAQYDVEGAKEDLKEVKTKEKESAKAESQSASLTLPSVIASGMVMQRDQLVRVWGWAEPKSMVSITTDWGANAATMVKEDGRWSTRVHTGPAGGPHVMTVKQDSQSIELNDILFGEVWVCGGQSNMEWTLGPGVGQGIADWENEAANANYPNIRLFDVPHQIANSEMDDASAKWKYATTESATTFSAVGFLYGRRLHEELNVPIGLISCNWGGTVAETWMSKDALHDFGAFESELKRLDGGGTSGGSLADKQSQWWKALNDANPSMPADRSNAELPGSWAGDLANFDGVVWYERFVEIPQAWAGKALTLNLGPIDDNDTTWFGDLQVGTSHADGLWNTNRSYAIPANHVSAGIAIPIRIRAVDTGGGGGLQGSEDQMFLQLNGTDEKISLAGTWSSSKGSALNELGAFPRQNWPHQNVPSVLNNGMLAPIIPYGIRGAIWYQGESNVSRPIQYRTLFPAMIQDWRARWGLGDFPFYFVQIAPFNYGDRGDSGMLRDAQRRALQTPNTGMAITMDIGNLGNIHPMNKQDVADRLARWALAKTYMTEVDAICGPFFEKAELENGNSMRVHFTHASGLTTHDGKAPSDFELLDDNGNWHAATATIDNNTLLVTASNVAAPQAVRYAWSTTALPNLSNSAGLPASTFTSE
ncbi:MAG: sulfatase-like hydrolase/transferase [Planctomycetes bacterium]|nr:sulfatase-like hydrolase/transferase [Planctomycetota bacterium]MCP4769938.1 sulfatase-like hydrolase/transferase [Planctomycetota bacterium]